MTTANCGSPSGRPPRHGGEEPEEGLTPVAPESAARAWRGKRSALWEAELIGGSEHQEIVIVAYDSAWPDRFEVHRPRITGALGPSARCIEHVGSTAVPGLAAKPIIDIQASVDNPDDESSYLPALEAAGYRIRVREAGHRMLRTEARDVHVHVCGVGSDWERRHLVFRDWLRHDDADRALYESTKRQLAQQSWPTMQHYSDAKTDVIDAILSRALWRE